jgi:phosphoribosylformimino-5-aminoimidazole carboxamide ribotide isomerase
MGINAEFTILPAIDIIDGQCVRLRQGDYKEKTVYGEDPLEVAQRWQQAGAEWLHVVDLDGAKSRKPVNQDSLRRIVENTNLRVEIGGGLRCRDDWKLYFDMGVERAILGSVALQHPERLEEAANEFPGKIVLGLDAKSGKVAVEGWTETSETTAFDVLKRFSSLPLAAVVYTDIAKDGMLEGPNLEETVSLAAFSPFPVILSGGISSLDDIKLVVGAARHCPKLAGLITGKALYEERFSLEDALALL